MKYTILILVLTLVYISLYWYTLPIPNILAKDLRKVRIKLEKETKSLCYIKPTSVTFEPITNSSYQNLYQEYEIEGKTYVYKALVKKYTFFKIDFIIVTASEVEQKK